VHSAIAPAVNPQTTKLNQPRIRQRAHGLGLGPLDEEDPR
jgi:hypothetical protein